MKVLILGAGGYFGGVLLARLHRINSGSATVSCDQPRCKGRADLAVSGTYRTEPRGDLLHLDVLDAANARDVIASCDPDAVVWCLTGGDRENDIGLGNILLILKPAVRFIYISSTLSSKENQDEETPPEPRSADMYAAAYINGKIRGEEATRAHPNHVIVRPGQIYGFGAAGEPDGRMRRVLDTAAKDGTTRKWADYRISVVHVEDLADCIIELFDADFTGTLCVASGRPVSYFEFYRFLAGQIGVDEDRIVPQYGENPGGNYFRVDKAKSLLKTGIRDLEPVLIV